MIILRPDYIGNCGPTLIKNGPANIRVRPLYLIIKSFLPFCNQFNELGLLLCLFLQSERDRFDGLIVVCFSSAQSHFQAASPQQPGFHFAALSCRSHAEDPDRIIELCVLRAFCLLQLFFQIFFAFRQLISVVDGFLLGLFRFSLRLSERFPLFLNRCTGFLLGRMPDLLISMIASCCSASGRSATDGSSSILAACASSLSSHTRKCFESSNTIRASTVLHCQC